MNRVLSIAFREFASTALTKGFIIGGFIVPVVLIAVMSVVLPKLMKKEAPNIVGDLAIIDRSGLISEDIAQRLLPETIAQSRADDAQAAVDAISDLSKEFGAELPANVPLPTQQVSTDDIPDISIESLGPNDDPEDAKATLRQGDVSDGGRLALAIIDEHAIQPNAEGDYGGFELFVKPKLDERVRRVIRNAIRESVRETRIEAAGWTPEELTALTDVDAPSTKEVTDKGERGSTGELGFIIPYAAMLIMLMGVMIGGQYLLTTTIEEKSSRVVEVLLSAVSPMQLMTGKIIGQMLVGMLIMIVYGGTGVSAMIAFAIFDLIDPMLLLWVALFFVIAYFQVASMFAAVGAAVNDLREAQSLMAPVMVVVMLPYMLGFAVATNPNSTFAVATSFIPPVNSFMMLIRLASTEPPPAWQALLSLGIGVIATFGFLWVAAKIFRIGLLMYGKPPSLGTLIKWARMG